jgi:tRNA pseudouridine38-40 synthase
MSCFKITLAYDGTDFIGWQRQAAGVSIQGVVEEAARALDEGDVTVTGAGRTDAGVHALGQVASFSLSRDITPDTLVRALNARLPRDVRVLTAEPVAPTFHARFGARSKTYRYRLWNADVVLPFERRYTWHVVGALDVGAMAEGARLIEGRHDFAAFQVEGSAPLSTERTVLRSEVQRTLGSPLIVYDIEGTGFLRHMVRSIAGTLVEIGRGRRGPEWMTEVIESRSRGAAGVTAPPDGLFLMAVRYGEPAARLAAEP